MDPPLPASTRPEPRIGDLCTRRIRLDFPTRTPLRWTQSGSNLAHVVLQSCPDFGCQLRPKCEQVVPERAARNHPKLTSVAVSWT